MPLRLSASALAAMLMLAYAPASAETFPSRTVKVIVPYTAGGGTDVVARPLVQRLSEKWGQPVIIENRPGAGTAIGAEAVARSPADGYTLLISDTTTYTVNPHVYRRLPYDPLKDFAPIYIVCRSLPVIAVGKQVPAQSLSEFIAIVKQHPGKYSYGSFGNGSYAHVALEQFKRVAGIDLQHVPYRGGAPVVTDLLSGQLAITMSAITNFWAHYQQGTLRILATATEKRATLVPDLPTAGETLPGYGIEVFTTLAAPAATPPDILKKIAADVAEIVNDPEYREKNLSAQFLEPVGGTREEFVTMLARDSERWRRLVERTGIKID
jgi:tripartite-type tricarboxylate transporter receptor subunit TctC